MKRLTAMAALALLAACSSEEPVPEAPASEPAATASASPAASAAPAAELNEIPAAFRGYWDAETGSCANWSDAQLTIEARRVQFYESLGEVTSLSQPAPDTLVIDFTMSGEGDTWTEQATYRLLDGGQVLESSFGDGEAFRRKRCEALVDMPME
ncbi:hypothetical protein [Alteraurantiacibacter buctensis]|uniref:Lipoprotein n=1 Tax=Alteraurantiacibacter buctensis TaxID=1503981 RepID=A0A844Z5T1_9SPHN|nr:hypothetical protein [Alteraurantiacibacter buctensis]MXO73163.1 hypothetical protein [Alteraurantiacibacter buctensis]